MNRILVVPVLLIFLFVMIGCGGNAAGGRGAGNGSDADSREGAEAARNNRLDAPDVREGVIDFISGDVEWSSGADAAWYPAEIGRTVRSGDALRTFADSWCEVKFADMAVIRLQENTQFTLDSTYDDENDAIALDAQVLKGTVAAKARKLIGRESLQVRTQTVVCAVRGTVFLVSADDERTSVAVDEGRVAVVPAALDLDDRKANADGDEKEVLERLDASMPVLQAGEEITLGARERDELARAVDAIAEALDAGAEEDAVESMGDRLAEAIGATEGLTEESEEVFSEMERIDVSLQDAEEEPARVMMSWETTPQDARIVVNGSMEGIGRISGNWTVGESVNITADRPGYKDFSGTFTAAEIDEYVPLTIALEKLPTRYFDLVLAQSEGSIVVDGREEGTSYSGAVSWGGSSHIRITAEGFNERRMQVTYDDAPSGRIDVDLDPVIAATLQVINGSVIGLGSAGNALVLADQEGTLIAVDAAGSRLWREVTTNVPNDDARPHRIGGTVFFSGIGEFVMLDAATGRVIHRSSQDPQTMHLFGRHSIPFGDSAVYPAKNELVLMDPASGSEIRRIAIPGGSQMTPAAYAGRLWIVAEDGTIHGFDASGNPVTRIPTGADRPIGHAPAVEGGTAYFGDRSGMVRAVDLNAGRVVWERSVGMAVQDDIAVSGPDLVVYANHDVFILDRATGRIRLPAIRGLAAPPVVSEGFLYGGTEDGALIAVSIRRGEEVAHEPINGHVRSGGAVWNEKVYFGTDQGELIAMNLQDSSLLDVSPEPENVR